MGPETIYELLDKGWLGVLSILLFRYLWIEIKSKKNSSGNNRRIGDNLPGNPGHSSYELLQNQIKEVKLDLAADILRIEKQTTENASRIYELSRCVSQIEGELGMKK